MTAARRQTEIASLGVEQARAAFLPQAHVSAGFTYNSPADNSTLPSFIALNGVREYLGLVSAVQELDTSGRLRAGRDRARADQQAAQLGLGIAERDLRRLVAGSYYRVLLARRLAQVARDALAESQAFETRTRHLFEKGEAARADVVKAEAQTAFLVQSVTAADLDAELANHELASFWTLDVAAPLDLKDVLDDPPGEPPGPAPDRPFLGRPELALLDAQRQGFLAESDRARAERRPQTSLTFQYGLDAQRVSSSDLGYAAFVGLQIPLLDWSRAKKAARQFELEADQVETNKRLAERSFSREYQDALSRTRLLYEQITSTRAQVQLSDDNLRLSRLRYDGGEGSALDVVAGQTQLAQARSNLYTAIARYLESRADLEIASGR